MLGTSNQSVPKMAIDVVYGNCEGGNVRRCS